MTDPSWLERLDPFGGPRGRWTAAALVVGFLAAMAIEPLWFVRVFTDAIPWAIGGLLDATGLSFGTALAIWAGAFVPATVYVALIVGRWLQEHGDEHPRVRELIQLRAIVTAAFAVGFFAARTYVFLGQLPAPGGGQIDAYLPVTQVWVQGHHIHHFFFGFALVAIACWIAIMHHDLDRRWTAGVFGAGLGVFIDEIGLLLTWGDYWARSSWFILAIVLTALLTATVLSWLKATSDLTELGPEDNPVDAEPEANAPAGSS